MTRQMSFTRFEQVLLPGFRERLDKAESSQDVHREFSAVVALLLSDAFGESAVVRDEDVMLRTDLTPGYELAPAIRNLSEFEALWGQSDLPRILAEFAQMSAKRIVHLSRHPEKTESKQRQGSIR